MRRSHWRSPGSNRRSATPRLGPSIYGSNGRGRQHFQLGEFSDAIAALEGMLRPEEAQPSFGSNDAAAISALAGSAVRVGDRVIGRGCAEFAAVVRASRTPELKRHAAWILAQQAAASGDPGAGLQILAELERELPPEEPLLPLFPLDVIDQPQLVRIAPAPGRPNTGGSPIGTRERPCRAKSICRHRQWSSLARRRLAARRPRGTARRDQAFRALAALTGARLRA